MIIISKEVRQRIMVDIDQARVNGVSNGPMLFKLILLECFIDISVTVMRLREKIFAIDRYMATAQGDVKKFNKFVKILNIVLRAHDQNFLEGDMLVSLFKD